MVPIPSPLSLLQNAIPTKALTDDINRMMAGFTTNGTQSPAAPGLAPGQPATLKDIVKPNVIRTPFMNGSYDAGSYFTNNAAVGWNLTIYRFPTGRTLQGEESRKLAGAVSDRPRAFDPSRSLRYLELISTL